MLCCIDSGSSVLYVLACFYLEWTVKGIAFPKTKILVLTAHQSIIRFCKSISLTQHKGTKIIDLLVHKLFSLVSETRALRNGQSS